MPTPASECWTLPQLADGDAAGGVDTGDHLTDLETGGEHRIVAGDGNLLVKPIRPAGDIHQLIKHGIANHYPNSPS